MSEAFRTLDSGMERIFWVYFLIQAFYLCCLIDRGVYYTVAMGFCYVNDYYLLTTFNDEEIRENTVIYIAYF